MEAALLNSKNWTWELGKLVTNDFPRLAWMATDENGKKWIVRMKGPIDSVREYVFYRILKKFEIFCPEVKYLTVPKMSAPRLRHGVYETRKNRKKVLVPSGQNAKTSWRFQLAMEYLDPPNRGQKFELNPYEEESMKVFLEREDIIDAQNLIISDVLGMLCNQFEPVSWMLLDNNQYCVIDIEKMFCSYLDPLSANCSLKKLPWLQTSLGRIYLKETCIKFSELTDDFFQEIIAPPKGYLKRKNRDIFTILKYGREEAKKWVNIKI